MRIESGGGREGGRKRERRIRADGREVKEDTGGTAVCVARACVRLYVCVCRCGAALSRRRQRRRRRRRRKRWRRGSDGRGNLKPDQLIGRNEKSRVVGLRG